MSRADFYIGTIPQNEAELTMGSSPWEPKNFVSIPFSPISPPPSFMFCVGSGCNSMATTSLYGIEYNSAIDVVRQDIENYKIVFDVDHYVVEKHENYSVVYLDPSISYHHLTPGDELIKYAERPWQIYIRKNFRKRLT